MGNTILRLFAVISISSLVACAAQPAAEESEVGSESALTSNNGTAPPNFLTVRPGLYRGGHPDGPGLDYLKSLGIKRIVNLEVADFIEATPWAISDELDGAKQRGIDELRFPMSAFEPAVSDTFDANQTKLTALLATATEADPIYVHCKHGQDRTGLVIGLERVEVEHWDPKKAHDEMVQIGFHTFFAGLEEYYENKTGFED
jgi:protein tyrosine/serine phosphatase